MTVPRVDAFVANSRHVAQRIWKTYRRQAHVIYPPVDLDRFTMTTDKEDYYLAMSRLVPYKRMDLIVDAFSEMPDKELVVIGDGPEYAALKRRAGPNVTMLGYQPNEAVTHYMEHARAFVFAAEEDFGIVAVEAQACGTPVIAFGRGGVTETIVPGETGVFFQQQTPDHLQAAVRSFEQLEPSFDAEVIRHNAERFGHSVFRTAFSDLVRSAYTTFQNEYEQEAIAPFLVPHS
jgi:glycosyltransferase involved in cell wall biosynthesis